MMFSALVRAGLVLGLLSYSSLSFAAEALSCMHLTKQVGGWTDSVFLTNACGQSVDLRDSLVQFKSNQSLKGGYWGSFGSLAYPENPKLASETTTNGYLVSLALTFPKGDQWWKPNTVLPAGGKVTLSFSATPTTTVDFLSFYPMKKPPASIGQLAFQFPSAPNPNLQTPSEVVLSDGSSYRQVVIGKWSQKVTMNDVPYGKYQVTVAPLTYAQLAWTGHATPHEVTVSSPTVQTVNVTYTQDVQYGMMSIALTQTKPETSFGNVVLQIKNLDTNTFLPAQVLNWSQQASVNLLTIGHRYQISADPIYGENYLYTPVFFPSSTVSVTDTSSVPISLTFTVSPLPVTPVQFQVSGLPQGKQVTLMASDNLGHTYTLSSGNTGQQNWSLPQNRQYSFSAVSIQEGGFFYSANISPASILLQTDAPGTPVSIVYTGKTMTTQISPYVDVTLNEVTQWDNASGSMQPTGLLKMVQDSGVKSLHLAFITASNGCQGTWAGYPVENTPTAYGVAIFKQLKAQGVKLNVALGGLSGIYLEQTCTNVNDLVNMYKTIIQAYQPDSLDFDIENNMQLDNVALDRMMQALIQIHQQYPGIKISFTLPVMPDGLVPHVGFNVLKRAKANGFDDYLVNVMAMDYGSGFVQKTMGQYAIDAANATFGQLKSLYPTQSDTVLWQRIGVTPMIGLNDTLPLNFSIEDAKTLKQFAQSKQMGLVGFWSFNRDKACAYTYVSIECSSQNPSTRLPNQSQRYQYTQTLNQ